jgi:hypothetical protein
LTLAPHRASGPIASKVQAERAKPFSQSDRRGLPKAKVRLGATVPPNGTQVEPRVVSDLPGRIPPIREELAIWRAFLSEEIDAIIRDDE